MTNKKIETIIRESDGRISAYKSKIMEMERTFRQLNSQNMQASLIQFEDFLDSNNIYAYKNWFDGVVWDGPHVRRHWVGLTLKYDYEKMPEPLGGMRLVEQGAKIDYELSYEIVPINVKKPQDIDPITKKPREEKKDIWLVHINIPRHFIDGVIEDDPDEVEAEEQPEEATNEVPADTSGEEAGGEVDNAAGDEEGGDLEL
jgi:hypothetical protein